MYPLFTFCAGTIYESKDEYKGDWETSTTWQGGVAPTTYVNDDVFNINGTVVITSDLITDKKIALHVLAGDTLIIAANLELNANDASFIDVQVNDGGVLIVTGSLSTGNNLDVGTSGKVVILGDLTTGNGADIVNTGDMYVVGETDGDITVTGSIGGLEELIAENPDLIDIIVDYLPSAGTTYYAIAEGDWDDANVWSTDGITLCSCNPTAADIAIIDGFDITVSSSISINKLLLKSNNVFLNNDLTIQEELILFYGYLHTSSTNLLTLGDGATVTGGGTTSFVNGPMQKEGIIDLLFPIGDITATDTVFGPLYVDLELNVTTSTYTVEYFFEAPSDRSTLGTSGFTSISAVEYWDVHKDAGENAKITMYFNDLSRSGILDISLIDLAHWTGTEWENIPSTSLGNAVTTDAVMTSFSPVTGGGGEGSLPVKLVSFKVFYENQETTFEWITNTEINNDYFTIEKSFDGINFDEIAIIAGAGSSSEELFYRYSDNDILEGISYFRLKQTDINGKYSYSDVIAIGNNDYENKFQIFPTLTKTNGVIYTTVHDPQRKTGIEILIIDKNGNTKFQNYINENQIDSFQYTLKLDNMLIPGIYFLYIKQGNAEQTEKIVVN